MENDHLASLLNAQQKIISMIALGSSLKACLNEICQSIESILNTAKAKSSILLLEGDTLMHGAAPSLPIAYCDAINGITIGPSVGSCGTAAFTKTQIIVEDIEHDPLWENFKAYALAHGLRACWSTPIMSSTNQVLGSFAIYYLEPKLPENYHLELIERFTHLSSLAIERFQAAAREKQLNAALKYSYDKFSAFTGVMPDLAFILEESGRYADIYGMHDVLSHLPKETLMGKNISDILPGELVTKVMQIIERVIRTDQIEIFEYPRFVHQKHYVFEGRIAPLTAYLADDPEKRHILWMARDITARKKAEQHVEKLAFYDPLTSLPNRRLLHERLNTQIEKVKQQNEVGVMFYLDLDDFKRINDSLGHSVGDDLLVKVAQRLKPVLNTKDTVARIGGDEFVIVFANLFKDADEACQYAADFAKKIISAFKDNFIINDFEYRIGVSIGACTLQGQDMDADEALKRADTAMYRSKKRGGNELTFFAPSLQRILDARLELEQSLTASIKHDDFCAHFQPQMNLQNQMIGAEALIRWNHPEKGLVSPMEFIPIAEQLGLIHKLQRIVLGESCKLILNLEKLGNLPSHFRVAVNISAIQFSHPKMKNDLLKTLQTYGVPASRIKLEITESMLIDDIPSTINKMNDLRKEGFIFSIDDFGTGYSSLTYLHSFPIDELKIDKSFIDKMHSNDVGVGIVDAIIALSGHMGFKVIAEGVEHQAQFDLLHERNVAAIQGYYFAKPMALSSMMAWFSASQSAT